MIDRNRQRAVLLGLTLIAAEVFFTGIQWGLPSRTVDQHLFGNLRPWTGAEILHLAGERTYDPTRGADVTVHPIEDRSHIVAINETDRQRAEIVRRYRMYSYQPDEMVTFMSLSGMRPSHGDFDPKLYQYGGLFIYPTGALLKVASKLGLIELKSDAAYYLDHPEAFGRFYIVVRGMVAVWGVVGVWAVFWLMHRLVGGLAVPALASLGYIFLPVVVNMAHEGKPHLPGAVLMLLTVLAAERYVQSGKTRFGLIAGALAGAALGMVISSLLVFVVLPLMTLLRPGLSWSGRWRMTAAACGVGVAVYGLTNPYVAINLVANRAVLRSNLGNSTAMYTASGWSSGLANAARLIGEGASPAVAIIGGCAVIAVIGVIWRHRRASMGTDRVVGGPPIFFERKDMGGPPMTRTPVTLIWLLAAPALAQAIQFFVLAAGKPGEYGRFALFLDIALLIAAMGGVAHLGRHRAWGWAGTALLALSVMPYGTRYLIGFAHDSQNHTSRLMAATEISRRLEGGDRSIAIWVEPAPYSMPPVDLFKTRLLLLPRDARVTLDHSPADILILPPDAVVSPVDASGEVLAAATFPIAGTAKRIISWADRSFCILHGP